MQYFEKYFLQKLYIIFIVYFVFQSCGVMYAQPVYDTKNKKAIEEFEKALKQYHYYKLDMAKASIENAIKHDPNFSDAFLLQAEIYRELKWTEKVLESYYKVLELNPQKWPTLYLVTAELEVNMGKYQEAKQKLEKFLTFPNREKEDVELGNLLLKNCDFAIEAMKNPVEFDPINVGEGINTRFSEYFPNVTVDGKMMLFTRRVPIDPSTNGSPEQEDFFISQFYGGVWAPATPMGSRINTAFNEGAPSLSADGRMLIFSACVGSGNTYGENREGFGSCDLFYSIREGTRWSEPKNMGAPINTSLWESQPSLSADGRTLYFIRGNKRQGNNAQDIYVSNLQDNGKWSNPVKLPDNINTPYREESVFIHPDGQTLYFSSNGHVGMGNSDIYVTKKLTDSTWSTPKNMGYPINTFNEEHSFFVSSNGQNAYFSSNREGGFGENDIYCFELPKAVQATPVTYMTGKSFDAQTRKIMPASIELIDLETGKTVYQTKSDPVNGKFLIVLPTNRNYALNASAEGYLFFSKHFELKKQPDAKPYYKDIALQPISIGETMVLHNILFEKDQYAIKPESKIELDKLVIFLNSNKTIKLEIQGHTDNTGTIQHNQILSENRAKAVYDYIISKGIDPQRLSHRGFGFSRPIEVNNCDSDTVRLINRRTEFKIIEK